MAQELLVSLVDMKAHLGEVTTTYDDFLTEQLTLISAAIENYCGRLFTENPYIQTVYYNDIRVEEITSDLYMYQYPITTLTSITEYENASGTPVPTILNANQYRVHQPSGTIYRIDQGYKVNWLTDKTIDSYIEFSYISGYNPIPPEIDSVVKSLVEERYNKKINGITFDFGSDVQRVSIPGTISVDFDFSLQSNERESSFGMIIGNYGNVLDFWRSERAVIGNIRDNYVS